MFHTANAWEDGDEVHLYGCCMNVVRAQRTLTLSRTPSFGMQPSH